MSQQANSDEDVTHEPTDVADRLLSLMKRIHSAANRLTYPRLSNPNQIDPAVKKQLFEVLGDISENLGFEDYSTFQLSFVGLCNRVIRDIGLINVKNERTRERWVDSVTVARSVFDADNFGKLCGHVLNEHFSTSICDRIEDASERLQTLGRTEAKKEELSEALDAAREALSTFQSDGKLPPEISNALKHYIQQIENAYKTYDDFGEDRFWSIYKEMFATFIQVHPIVAPSGFSEDMKKSVNNMAEKMSYGLRALSVGADVITLTTATVALLTVVG